MVIVKDEATLSHSSRDLVMFSCLYHPGTRLDHINNKKLKFLYKTI